jgi:hypothetical protein
MRTRRSRWAAALVAVLTALTTLLVGAQPAAAATSWHSGACTASDQNSVTMVIDFQKLGGSTIIRCAVGLPTGATGYQALQAIQMPLQGTVHDGPAFICRINNRPGPNETIPVTGDPTYKEDCVDTPPAKAYWSYWWAKKGQTAWTYSAFGAMTHRVEIGGFEGWSFSLNATASTNPAPRVKPGAPTVVKQGIASGTKYRLGSASKGGLKYSVGLEVARDAVGVPVQVRSTATITKISKAKAVQVDGLTLGTSSAAVLTKTAAVNSGAAGSATSVSAWKTLTPGSCVSFRTRGNFSVRWDDGGLSQFSVLSSLSQVCRA